MERESTLMVWELKHYNIFAATISEMKWLGNNIYEVEGHAILHLGRPLPGDGEQMRRGEGVGLVLSPEAIRAWSQGGEAWQTISSRVITARLPLKKDTFKLTSLPHQHLCTNFQSQH